MSCTAKYENKRRPTWLIGEEYKEALLAFDSGAIELADNDFKNFEKVTKTMNTYLTVSDG